MNLKEKEEKLTIFKRETNELAKSALVMTVQKDIHFHPILSILSYSPEKEYNISVDPIPSQFMDPKLNDLFVDFLLPQCVQGLREEGHRVICVAFVVDTFMTIAPKEAINIEDIEEVRSKMEDYKKREALAVTYSTYDATVSDIFMYKKQGNNVVFIEAMSQMQPHKSSRFTDLLKIDPNDN